LLLACAASTPAPRAPDANAPPGARPAPTPFVSPYAYEWFVRAELLRARGEHAAAAEAYQSALTSGDDDAYLLARLAEAREAAGEPAAADDALRAALTLDPRSEAAWLASAHVAQRRGDRARALAALERAEQAVPGSQQAPAELAELLRSTGQPERALAVLERAAGRGPGTATAALRARLELARARGDGAALARAAADWLAYAGGDGELLRRTAAELLAAGQPVLAERVLAALPDDPRDAALRLSVALALARYARVEQLLATVAPHALGGTLTVADAYLQIGKPERASALLAERERSGEDDPNRRLWLEGACQLALGDPAAAAELLVRVPAGSLYYARARTALRQAFGAAGLPALGGEVGGEP
jgi:tetratricopeptide (TPR) repeat protein